jgi:hypothetical protein
MPCAWLGFHPHSGTSVAPPISLKLILFRDCSKGLVGTILLRPSNAILCLACSEWLWRARDL